MSLLKKANTAFRQGDYESAYKLYVEYKAAYPELGYLADFNIALIERLTKNKNVSSYISNSGLTQKQLELMTFVVSESGLFDEKFYLEQNPDLKDLNISLVEHFIEKGGLLGCEPSSLFDLKNYQTLNKNIVDDGVNALFHFLQKQKVEDYIENESRLLKESESDVDAKVCKFSKEFNFDKESDFLTHIDSAYLLEKNTYDRTLISIIMPTYNRANTIISAVSSVLKQTHKNWELLIIDDGSTDNTKDVLKGLMSDSRIKLINGKHRGVSAARNLGLKQAQGSLISYLDSDNAWTDEYLQTMLVFLMTRHLDCAYAGTRIISSNNHILGYRGDRFNWEECLKSNYIDMNIFVHKRNMLAKGFFDEILKRAVDWDLVLRYTKDSQTAYAPFIGCNYLDEKTGASRITDDEPMLYGDIVYLKNRYNYSHSDVHANLKLKIAIKVPCPEESKLEWGDYHYALSLKEALEKINCEVRVDTYENWYVHDQRTDRVAIVLRGLREYKLQKGQLSIMWNISHPDKILYDEYENFHINYIASTSYADLLRLLLNRKTKVKPLLQATDVYRGKRTSTKNKKILFIGNSRKIYRNTVKWCIELGYEIDVYGTNWEEFIPKKFIKGNYVDNSSIKDLYKKYSVVLNDHWDSMRDYGFVSNRVYDVLSCGGNLISDHIESISSIFQDSVPMVKNKEELKVLLSNMDEINIDLVNEIESNHSFGVRAVEIKEDILNFIGLDVEGASGDSKSYKVAVLINNPNGFDKNVYYRICYQLVNTYAENKFDISLIDIATKSDNVFESNDIFIMQGSSVTSICQYKKFFELKTSSRKKLIFDMDLDIDEFSLFDLDIQKSIFQYSDCIVYFSSKQRQKFNDFNHKNELVIENSIDNRIWKKRYYSNLKTSKVIRFVIYGNFYYTDAIAQSLFSSFQKLYQDYKNHFEVVVIGEVSSEFSGYWLKNFEIKNVSNYAKLVEALPEFSAFDFGIVFDCNSLSSCGLDLTIRELINSSVYPLYFGKNNFSDVLSRYQLRIDDIYSVLKKALVQPGEYPIEPVKMNSPQLHSVVLNTFKNQNSLNVNIKPICFYLPQFYPTETNNKNWGEGFTEWQNVTKSVPRFQGHIQPKIPTKFGFYDLRLSENMKRQSDFAMEHGIYAFCFYYYRFGVHRELDVPVSNYKKLQGVIPYLFCWANESWTRAWDGVSDESILTQDYGEETFNGVLNDLLYAYNGNNYLEHDGKPIFLIYQINKIPNLAEWLENLKSAFYSQSKKELIIGGVYNPSVTKEMATYVDFLVQFPPHRIPRKQKRKLLKSHDVKPFEEGNNDYFESYNDVVDAALGGHDLFPKTYLGVCPDWDNSPRRKQEAHILIGSTPEKFESWVSRACEITNQKYKDGEIFEKYIFVNAWNEWAEGAVLEPSEKSGDTYISKIRSCLNKFNI